MFTYSSLPVPSQNASSKIYLLSCVLYPSCTLPSIIFTHCFKIPPLAGSFTSFLGEVCTWTVDGKLLCYQSNLFLLSFLQLADSFDGLSLPPVPLTRGFA